MGRSRPERTRSQWADLRAATDWYLDACQARGVDREEAVESWESLSIEARIRRYRSAVRAGDERALLAQANQQRRVRLGADNAAIAAAIVPGPHSDIAPPAPTRGADVDDDRGMDEQPEPFDECTGPMPGSRVESQAPQA
jgi:hypothetical protein